MNRNEEVQQCVKKEARNPQNESFVSKIWRERQSPKFDNRLAFLGYLESWDACSAPGGIGS